MPRKRHKPEAIVAVRRMRQIIILVCQPARHLTPDRNRRLTPTEYR